jgi:hypothetical protein
MKTYKEFSEQAYSSKSQIDEGLGTALRMIGRVAKKPLQKAATGAMNWFNKGKNTRIPNEAQAPFGTPLEYFKKNPNPKTLFGDDALQRGMSDAAYSAGKKPSLLGRPDQAFNPFRPASKGGPGSGPTPITREIIKRPIRAAKKTLGLDK